MSQNQANTLPAPVVIRPERLRRLQDELRHAWSKTSRDDLLDWGASCGREFMRAATRRAKNIIHLAWSAITLVSSESMRGYWAYKQDRLQPHLRGRLVAAGNSISKTYEEVSDFAGRFAQSFRNNPQETGVQFLTVVITSLLVSGGPDGDGGAPDLDLAFGIGAHRSILSHSILMGAALETGVLSLLSLVKITHAKLPDRHDSLWDGLHDQAIKISPAASVGVSVGMAYHLLVDGLVQPAPYHDLPIPMPIETHQTLFVVNGLGEAVDVGKKEPHRDRNGNVRQ